MVPASDSQRTIRWLILARAVVATLLAVAVVGVHVWGALQFPLAPFLVVVAISYLVSLISWGLVARYASPRFAEIQIYLDVLLETALIYVTGGAFSMFPFVYLLSILATSIVVAPRRSFVTAAISVICHGVLLDLQFYRVIPPIDAFATRPDVVAEGSITILLIAGNACASFIVAYLATHVAEQLRQVRSEARRTEASLAELQVFHEDIVQSVSSGLVTFDRVGRVLSANRTVEALSGRHELDLRAEPWERVFDHAPRFDPVWRALDDGRRGPCRFQADLVRADGSTIPIGVTASLLRRGSEGLLGVICSFQDLTEIKRMEAQVRQADRLAAIGRLAAGLAHEIRNPIASIRGSIEVLRENLAPQGTDRQLMDIVLRESDRLDGTIAEFLEFSRPRHLQPELTDLVTLAEEVLILLAHQGATGVRIEKEFLDGTVKALVDPTQVRQALWNLVRNALEAMPDGGTLRVAVAVSRARDAEGHEGVALSVEDTGVGISPEHLPHVFEPFYTTKSRGTGLGLAIVHRIVEEHEGEILIERPAGGGTRFTLRFPRRDG